MTTEQWGFTLISAASYLVVAAMFAVWVSRFDRKRTYEAEYGASFFLGLMWPVLMPVFSLWVTRHYWGVLNPAWIVRWLDARLPDLPGGGERWEDR